VNKEAHEIKLISMNYISIVEDSVMHHRPIQIFQMYEGRLKISWTAASQRTFQTTDEFF
jgi:hypothetical protein